MAIHTEWVGQYSLLYVRHIGSIKPYQVENFFTDIQSVLHAGSLTLLLDLREAMYTDELLNYAFAPQYLREGFGHPNVMQVISIIPENHPLRALVLERYKEACSLHKLRFVNNLDEACYYLSANRDDLGDSIAFT